MDRHLFPLFRGAVAALVVSATGAGSAAAQQTQSYEPPAHVAFVDGVAAHEREGTSRAPEPGVLFLPGDRLRSADGRLEVLFPDGSALHLDEFTEVDLVAPTLLRLTAGRILLLIAGAENPRDAMTVQVDTIVGSATADGPGEYRVAVRPSVIGQELEFSVYRGWGLITTEQGATELAAGERSMAREGVRPEGPRRFNVSRFDAFDRWSQVRRDSRMVDVTSANHLPTTLRSYGATFDQYGSWDYEPDYGNVWYPTVAASWRPYYNGYWSPYPSYGWTWVGHDPWGWPTHHYGRWGYARSRWFWIPDHHWGPGWVSWAYAPGYTAWSPLGYGNVPVFGLSVGFGGAWGGGWVVTTGSYFSAGVHGVPVHHYAVAPRYLPPASNFAPRPNPPPVAVPRSAPAHRLTQVAQGGGVAAPRAGASSRTPASLSQPAPARVTQGRAAAETGASLTGAGAIGAGRTASTTRVRSSDAARASAPTLMRSAPARSASPAVSSEATAPSVPEAGSAPRGGAVTRGRAQSLAAPASRQAPSRAPANSGLSPTSRIQNAPSAAAPPSAAPATPSRRALTPPTRSSGGSVQATQPRSSMRPTAPAAAPPANAPSAPAPAVRSAPRSGMGARSQGSAPAARASSAPAAAQGSQGSSSSTGSVSRSSGGARAVQRR